MTFSLDELLSEETKGTTMRNRAKMAEDDNDLLITGGESFLDEARRYLSLTKVKRLAVLGTELFGAASPFLEKPTWWNAAKATFAVGKVLVEDVEVWADDFFGGDEWTAPYSDDFNQALLHVLQKFPYERLKTAEDNTFVRVCKLPNGIKAGWTYSGQNNQVHHIYVNTERLEEAREFIKRLLWEQYEGSSLVMRRNNRIALNDTEGRVVFEVDNDFESKSSKRASDMSAQLAKPIANGISRSIMFYGPPGTGKSTLARTLVEQLGLRSFRIRIADLGGIDSSTLFEAVSIFQPDAIILDDFDRANAQTQLLETLEFFQQKVKLVITTVNNRQMLDEALLRPGRIDILELVDRMDDDVIKTVLGDYIDGYDIVKDWPIAFITEYVKRRTYMTVEEAAESVKELTRRVRELDSYRDDPNSDMKRMLKAIKRSALESGDLPEGSDETLEDEVFDDVPFE